VYVEDTFLPFIKRVTLALSPLMLDLHDFSPCGKEAVPFFVSGAS